ncbi:MAG: radical SAM family heme chaperone HemW [Pseudomonadota bacterium]
MSIYVHWAFCKSKCPYCDFNSHVRASVDEDIWQKALLAEISYYAEKLPNRKINSIFFGGGTPSLMNPKTVEAIISTIYKYWKIDDNIEITLEANPTSVEAEKFRNFRKAGVNRVSVGVQSFNEKDLKFLGREHSVNEAISALNLAHEIFPRMSFDLIYALPEQSESVWEKELLAALKYSNGHISLYQLTIEENTAFHHIYHNGGFLLPEENAAAKMYQVTQDITVSKGLFGYEISNYAAIGQESRHNLAYWTSEDYIGIGAGAHGRFNLGDKRIATENIKSPERWLEKTGNHQNGIEAEIKLSDKESMEEAIMMGMRLAGGINYKIWQERTGLDIKSALNHTSIAKLKEYNLIDSDINHIKATQKGKILLNGVIRELLG